ncbi:hypothetical protein GCM10010872_19120 [Dyella flava]|nr:hypothetical protein GCM10010872_19120 [Dyella flava]
MGEIAPNPASLLRWRQHGLGLPPDRHPALRPVGPGVFDNYDARFERWPRVIIAGFAQEIAA